MTTYNKAQELCIEQWGEYPEALAGPNCIRQFLDEFNEIDPTPDPATYKIVYLREGDLEGAALKTGLTLKQADDRVRKHLIDTLTEADASLDSSSYRRDRQITWRVSATMHRLLIVMED